MPRSWGVVLLVALAFWALLGVFAGRAAGNHVACGDVVTQDTTLDSDLIDCPGDGIVVGADGVTLDLGGHVVDGDGDFRPRPALGCDTGIVNGRFDDCGNGAGPGHDGVTIRNGTVREFAHGVQVVDADRIALLRLRLTGNTGFGGIATYLLSNGRIEDNRALDNKHAGIAVYEPTGRTTIVENVLGRNRGYGIELAGGSPGDRVEGNVTFGNGGAFLISWATGLLLAGNRSFDNGAGMNVFEGLDNRIERNRLWGNRGAGLSVSGHRNRIERNAVVHNDGAGIVLSEAEDNVVVHNHATRNAGDGIAFGSLIEHLLVDSNRARDNGGDGISLAGGVGVTLRRNLVDRNGDDGIDVQGGDVALARNSARFNLDLGIEAVAGTTDGGGNRAFGNGNPLQCLNVACR